MPITQIKNNYHRCIMVISLIIGLICAPITPQSVLAAEQDPQTPDVTADQPSTPSKSDESSGVDVSEKPAAGKGALAPPPEKDPQSEAKPAPVKTVEEKKRPKAIGASAGKAGPPATESGKGLSLGWKITAGVLGVGLLLGLAGGSGGGGGGGGTTPSHSP